MKKLWLTATLALGLVLLAWCTPTTQQWSSDVLAVYNESQAMTCNLTYTAEWEEWTAVLYVKDGMIREDTVATVDWEEYSISTLARDGKMYMWWDIYENNAWFTFDYEVNMEDELWNFTDLDEWTTISCVNGVKKSSVFNVPNWISFSSVDDRLGAWEDIELEWDDTVQTAEIQLEVTDNELAEDTNEVSEETDAE